jgi:hypothetical protein
MRKTVVIHQPDFLPYLGFFERLLHADLYVVLDNVQFVHSNQGWTHRDKIKTAKGAQWVTVNVKRAPRDTPINKVELSWDTDWKSKNLNLIRQNYQDAPYFAEFYPYIERLYAYDCMQLADFTMKSIEILLEAFAICTPLLLASELAAVGRKNGLLVDILKKVGGIHYLTGVGAKTYLNEALFHAAGIEIIWQDFSHPIYPQLHGKFIPYLSSIDLLFNCGIEESRRILRSC